MLTILLLTTVLAEEPQPIIVYQQRTEIDFESVDIAGEMIKPEGILTQERQTAVFNPLIKLRTDWNVEMEQSVNTIE